MVEGKSFFKKRAHDEDENNRMRMLVHKYISLTLTPIKMETVNARSFTHSHSDAAVQHMQIPWKNIHLHACERTCARVRHAWVTWLRRFLKRMGIVEAEDGTHGRKRQGASRKHPDERVAQRHAADASLPPRAGAQDHKQTRS